MVYHEACDDCYDKFDCKYRHDNIVEECQEAKDYDDTVKLMEGDK